MKTSDKNTKGNKGAKDSKKGNKGGKENKTTDAKKVVTTKTTVTVNHVGDTKTGKDGIKRIFTEYKKGKFDWRRVHTDAVAPKVDAPKADKKADKKSDKKADAPKVVTIANFPAKKLAGEIAGVTAHAVNEDNATLSFTKVSDLTPAMEMLEGKYGKKFDFARAAGEGKRVYNIVATVKK